MKKEEMSRAWSRKQLEVFLVLVLFISEKITAAIAVRSPVVLLVHAYIVLLGHC
jgi:hypothetical protein